MKRREFALDPSITRFRLSEPLRRPVLTAEPSIYTRVLNPQDKFIIFASDGLWEQLTNQQAVEIVRSNPRRVCLQHLTLKWFVLFVRKTYLNLMSLMLIGNRKEAGKGSTETSCAEEGNEV